MVVMRACWRAELGFLRCMHPSARLCCLARIGDYVLRLLSRFLPAFSVRSTFGANVFIPNERPTQQCADYLSVYQGALAADSTLVALDSSDMVR